MSQAYLTARHAAERAAVDAAAARMDDDQLRALDLNGALRLEEMAEWAESKAAKARENWPASVSVAASTFDQVARQLRAKADSIRDNLEVPASLLTRAEKDGFA